MHLSGFVRCLWCCGCVNVCGVVCGVCSCFLRLGVVFLCCDEVGVWDGVIFFYLSVMRAFKGVLLWIVCVFCRVGVSVGVCCAPSCYSEWLCVICSLLMFMYIPYNNINIGLNSYPTQLVGCVMFHLNSKL